MDEHIIDARWLAPPEPMELTLAALETLKPGEQIRLLIHREPSLLFQILDEWGYGFDAHNSDDGGYEILIWHKLSAAPHSESVAK